MRKTVVWLDLEKTIQNISKDYIKGHKKKQEKVREVTARTLAQIQTSGIKVARRTNKFHTALKRVNEKHGKTLKKLG